MQIKDFLSDKAIEPNLRAQTKEEVLRELTDLLEKTGKISDREEFLRVILEREELGSTGIGYNIAIPHARSSGVKSLVGAFGISREGIDFDALDKDYNTYCLRAIVSPKILEHILTQSERLSHRAK